MFLRTFSEYFDSSVERMKIFTKKEKNIYERNLIFPNHAIISYICSDTTHQEARNKEHTTDVS